MLFPISDDDQALSSRAVVTLVLVVVNVLVFGYQLAEPAFTYAWSVVPQEITTGQDLVNARPIPEEDPAAEVRTPADIPQRPGPGPAPFVYLTMLSAMFMHGGWGHLGGNLLYLWIFGDNVEHRFGAGPFLLFYLGSGIAATVAQVATDPSGLVPNLGASEPSRACSVPTSSCFHATATTSSSSSWSSRSPRSSCSGCGSRRSS